VGAMARIDPRTIFASGQLNICDTRQADLSAHAGPPSAWSTIRALLPFSEPGSPRKGSETVGKLLSAWPDSSRHWGILAHEAEYHGVVPLLAPLILGRYGPARAPAAIDANKIFVALAARHRRAAVTRETCIDELLDAFSISGMRILLLKGAALGHLLYASPGRRAARDIDILIDDVDEPRAIDLVRELGFKFIQDQDPGFSKRHHHLPPAVIERNGFSIALEIHRDAISLDQPYRLTFRSLTQPPQPLDRGSGPRGLIFGHVDMLHHLARHAFEPAECIRLVNLFDLYCYRNKFRDEIDWDAVQQSHPHVCVVLQLVDGVFSADGDAASLGLPTGIGAGMLPLAEISSADCGLVAKLDMLLNPPAWWLHGYYGVAPGRSLLGCRAVRHPTTVARWLGRRLVARAAGAAA
jgi:hypothetical protein